MKKTPSSIAWLNSKYSRTKGQVARLGERIKDVEARLDLHRHKSQQCEEQLVALRDALAQAETLSEQFAHALKLHELAPQVEAVGKILPNEHRRFFKHGGMTAAIYRSIKSAPASMLTIDELQSQMIQSLELPQRDVARFRMRLQTRLQIMLREGKVISPDHNGASGRRWLLSKDWTPARPAIKAKKYSTHRSIGSVQPARWLIQSQRDIAVIKSNASVSGNAQLSSKLTRDLDAVKGVWRQHPLHFEVDLEWTPSSRASHYRSSVYARVSRALAQAEHGMTITSLQAACPCPSNDGRRTSIRAIEAALKQMMLEGRVEHRHSKLDGELEWRLASMPKNQGELPPDDHDARSSP